MAPTTVATASARAVGAPRRGPSSHIGSRRLVETPTHGAYLHDGHPEWEVVLAAHLRLVRPRTCVLGLSLILVLPACQEALVRAPKNDAPLVIDTPQAVVQALAVAYQRRDFDLLRSILAHDPARNADYVFFLSQPTKSGETEWGWVDEIRIHQRMFHPNRVPAEDAPVPQDLWLQGVHPSLVQLTPFRERTDLYSANQGQDGRLDSTLWKAMDALYGTDVFFDTRSDIDFQVTARANFVVLEDLTKTAGADGRFLLYSWEDMPPAEKPGAGPTAVEPAMWGSVKQLYLPVDGPSSASRGARG